MNVFSYPQNAEILTSIERRINLAREELNKAVIESHKLHPAMHPYSDRLISRIELAQGAIERLDTLYYSLKGEINERKRRKSTNDK